MKVAVVVRDLVRPWREAMHRGISEPPESVRLRRIWVGIVCGHKMTKPHSIPVLWLHKAAKCFHRGQGANERQECTVIVKQRRNPAEIDAAEVTLYQLD